MDPGADERGQHSRRAPAGDVVIDRVAGDENALGLGMAQPFECCGEDRPVRLADEFHRAAERLIKGCQRAGRRNQSSRAEHDKIGIGAQHRHPSRRSGGQAFAPVFGFGHRFVEPAEQDEVGISQVLDDTESETVHDRTVAAARNQEACAAETDKRLALVRVQSAPGNFARRQHAVIGIERQAKCGKALLIVIGASTGVGKHQHAFAGLPQPRHAFDRFGEDRLAFVQGSPLVEQDVVEPFGDGTEPRDGDRTVFHGGPPCKASSAAP